MENHRSRWAVLADIRQVFTARSNDKLFSKPLVEALCAMADLFALHTPAQKDDRDFSVFFIPSQMRHKFLAVYSRHVQITKNKIWCKISDQN